MFIAYVLEVCLVANYVFYFWNKDKESKGNIYQQCFLAKRKAVTHITDLKIIVTYSNVNSKPEPSNCGFYLGLESYKFTLPAQPETLKGSLFWRDYL